MIECRKNAGGNDADAIAGQTDTGYDRGICSRGGGADCARAVLFNFCGQYTAAHSLRARHSGDVRDGHFACARHQSDDGESSAAVFEGRGHGALSAPWKDYFLVPRQ